MTDMSVYRQAERRTVLPHTTCIAGSVSAADVTLIGLSLSSGKPALIGLDGRSTIVKPEAPGDDRLIFAGLYDDCYTSVDIERMERAKVPTPEEIPPDTHRVDLKILLEPELLELTVLLKARNLEDIRAAWKELIDKDIMFRETLIEGITRCYARQMRNGTIGTKFDIMHSHLQDPDGELQLPADRQWRIMYDGHSESED